MSSRRLTAALGAAALGALLVVPTTVPAATKHRKIHFTTTLTGAATDATHNVYAGHDSYGGAGAGAQTITINATGTAGTDSEITYYANGSARSNGTYTLGMPDANGIAALTGAGHDTGGTGKFKGVKSTYTYTGTLNTKTGVFTAKLTGIYTI
jgi:hypothetical protein